MNNEQSYLRGEDLPKELVDEIKENFSESCEIDLSNENEQANENWRSFKALTHTIVEENKTTSIPDMENGFKLTEQVVDVIENYKIKVDFSNPQAPVVKRVEKYLTYQPKG